MYGDILLGDNFICQYLPFSINKKSISLFVEISYIEIPLVNNNKFVCNKTYTIKRISYVLLCTNKLLLIILAGLTDRGKKSLETVGEWIVVYKKPNKGKVTNFKQGFVPVQVLFYPN